MQTTLYKLKTKGVILGSICNINQGILTGIDKITKKHVAERLVGEEYLNHGVFVLNKKEVEDLHLSLFEHQIIKPFFKNSDIHKYSCDIRPEKFVIYATRDLDINQFPNIKNHFTKFERAICARSTDRGEMQAALKLGKWWVIFAARTLNVFTKNKIVCAQRSYQNNFGFNAVPWLASADVYFITQKNGNVNLKYVLALLNSKLYYLWLYHRGKRKGEMLELLYTPLLEIPIANITPNEQGPFIEIVDQILALTNTGDYLKNNGKQTFVKKYEQQIDKMVYGLYGLNEEEIEVVERSVKYGRKADLDESQDDIDTGAE